ncbi:MAG: hypothetical protein HC884_18690 [Chloroflexaceae bacterium]|nr:hypothetical protein [Chloroflexaceae bacterium]
MAMGNNGIIEHQFIITSRVLSHPKRQDAVTICINNTGDQRRMHLLLTQAQTNIGSKMNHPPRSVQGFEHDASFLSSPLIKEDTD